MVGIANNDHIFTLDISKNDTPVLTVARRENGVLKVKKTLYGEEAEHMYIKMKEIIKRRTK